MAKVQTVGKLSDFMRTEIKPVIAPETSKVKVLRFIDENQATLWQGAGYAVVILFAGAGFETAFASGGLDEHAAKIYDKLLGVGKWVIVGKGGIETIKAVASSDLPAAQRNFLQYLLIYALLWALPWGMNEVENMFIEMRG
jgi:hypothetical protein